MRELHTLLFYLTHDYHGVSPSTAQIPDTANVQDPPTGGGGGLDKSEILRQIKMSSGSQWDDDFEAEFNSMKVYHPEIGWRMFIPPLPKHEVSDSYFFSAK